LHFLEAPDITPGETVKVWGKQIADAIEVDMIKVAAKLAPSGDIGSQSSELIGRPMRRRASFVPSKFRSMEARRRPPTRGPPPGSRVGNRTTPTTSRTPTGRSV